MIYARSFYQLLVIIIISTSLLFCKSENSFAPAGTKTNIDIPARAKDAMDGLDFAGQISGLSLEYREMAITEQILSGNVPSFSRKLQQIKINHTTDSSQYQLVLFTACDYLAIGSDEDYLYVPMTPTTAQYLADQLDCILPTKKLVDIIYAEAGIKLQPQPIPPSDKMTTVPVFMQHTDSVKHQISHNGFSRSADNIFAGHKKDIIISNKIYSPERNYNRVVIYGWHLNENNPIQPVYNGHLASYADYSHGVRLIHSEALLNGDTYRVTDLLKDQSLYILLSNEGIISTPYYPGSLQ
ncbi:MAG: hypothetical protein U9N53_11920 [Bacteroidota bacterium]|nr:hypothetical protein [Bacteroidota bacterium]